MCFKRLQNLFGKEFALCSLSLVFPKEARRNDLSEDGAVVVTPVLGVARLRG